MRLPAAAWDRTSRLRGAVEKLADDFRRADRFFKMRAGVVAAWALISAATLAATCPSSGPGNSLGADVRVQRDTFLGGEQIMVRNESDEIWTNVVLTLDREWMYREPTLRPNHRLVVSTSQFRRGADPPPLEYRPRTLKVECSQGSHTLDVR